jgi:hypothetical protein
MRPAVFLILSANFVLAQPKPPALLVEALRQLPGVHLLNRALDIPDDSLEKNDAPLVPWIVADLDHDGRPDVVTVVAKHIATETQFGVVAVHARTPAKLNWVVPLGNELIYGVIAEGPFGVVVPLFCIACDANAWFNWTGQSYEMESFGIGQRLSIDHSEPGLPVAMEVFALPKETSRIIGRVKPCTKAKVVAVRGTTTETRWYFVDVFLSQSLRGWIPATSAVVEYACPAH